MMTASLERATRNDIVWHCVKSIHMWGYLAFLKRGFVILVGNNLKKI